MNIEWNILEKGFSDELSKIAEIRTQKKRGRHTSTSPVTKGDAGSLKGTAAVGAGLTLASVAAKKLSKSDKEDLKKTANAPAPKWWQKPWVKPAVYGTGAVYAGHQGLGMVDAAKKSIGDVAEGLAGAAPFGLAALMGLSGNKQQSNDSVHVPYYPQYQKPSYLTPDPGTVSSISSPRAYANPIKVGSIVGSFEDAVQRRIANSVLNKVTNTDALGFPIDQSKKQGQPNSSKELEIVAKYPELEELLQDESNKNYLKKLLDR